MKIMGQNKNMHDKYVISKKTDSENRSLKNVL